MTGKRVSGRIFSVLVYALMSVSVSVSGASAEEPTRAAAMLRLLGFDTAIGGFAQEVRRTQTGMESDSPEFQKARDALVEVIFDKDLLFDAVAARVDDKFNDAEYDALNAYFSKGVGKRVTEVEKYAQSPENSAERKAETPEIIEDMLANNPERMDQIEQMVTVMDVASSGTAMAMNLGYAMISGMASTGQMPGGMTDAQILHILNANRDQIETEVVNSAVLDAAFTYRDISNSEMRNYLEFLQGDLGRKLYNVLHNAQADVLSEATRRYGQEVMLLSGQTEL